MNVGIPAALALAATGLMAGPAAAAEGEILGSGTTEVVTDSYVVVLKDATSVDKKVSSLKGRYGGTVGHTYESALGGFEVRLGEKAAKRLAADPRVDFVQRNGIYTTQDVQEDPTWGLDRIDQAALPVDKKYEYATTASGVTAFVIDTGVRTTHEDFGGRASSGFDAVDNDDDATDCNGHGTHVAGTIGGTAHGVAKEVKLVGVRVLDCEGSGSTAQVVAGIDWVTENAKGPSVANMSLGGGADAAIDEAVEKSIAAGVTYAVASGNENTDACSGSPARVKAAITVNASTDADARAEFSNFGSCTDIYAPGEDITSTWFDSDTATNTISGTSMATPHVAGAAALVLAQNEGFTPAQVAEALVSSATSDTITDEGAGSPNKLLFTGSAGG